MDECEQVGESIEIQGVSTWWPGGQRGHGLEPVSYNAGVERGRGNQASVVGMEQANLSVEPETWDSCPWEGGRMWHSVAGETLGLQIVGSMGVKDWFPEVLRQSGTCVG